MTTTTPMRIVDPTDEYADMADRFLAAALANEDAAEERGLSPLDRQTCRIHRRWIHECIASPVHVIMITGHRWCRGCQTTAMVSVDHLSGSVKVRCPRCWRVPNNAATQQIIRTCEASFVSAGRHRDITSDETSYYLTNQSA